MATTTNFGWETPDDTDLVKDGAAAIRTALGGVDTSFVDLKGGTTGQVLAKASNTDLDFVWSADASGIPATIFDAKGDLIAATAADTASRLAVGTNGQVLTADSTTATGLKWGTVAAGGMTQLATGTLSGASVSITSISGSYRNLWLVIKNFRPAVDTDALRMRVNNDTNTRYEYLNNNSANTFNNTWDDSFWGITTNTDDTTNQGITTVEIFDYANTDTMKLAYWQNLGSAETTTTNYNFTRGHLFYNQTAAINRIDLYAGSGNLTAGTYILYGVS